jgi:hypothetical protein
MELLFEYLCDARLDQWEKLVQTYAFVWLNDTPQFLEPEAGAELENRLGQERGRFLPGPMAQVGADAPVLTRVESQGWWCVLARSAATSLRKGAVDRLVLRLFDEQEARESSDFEASWRGLLQTWNLLQFHDDTRVFSSELILERGELGEESWASEVAEKPDAPYTVAGDSDLEELLEFATAAARPLLQAVHSAGLQSPAMAYELPIENGCGPEADLAWPTVQVAVLAESQLEDAPAFETAGWFVMVHPVDPNDLVKVIGERESR